MTGVVGASRGWFAVDLENASTSAPAVEPERKGEIVKILRDFRREETAMSPLRLKRGKYT